MRVRGRPVNRSPYVIYIYYLLFIIFSSSLSPFSFSLGRLMLLECRAWREAMRGCVGPLGAESACAEASPSAGRPLNLENAPPHRPKQPLGAGSGCAEASLSAGRPLNLVLYIPFRMFAYSSNNFKAKALNRSRGNKPQDRCSGFDAFSHLR